VNRINRIITLLRRATRDFQVPIVTQVSRQSRDSFQVLISCLLSLRTKDEVTAKASERLFSIAHTPKNLLNVPIKKIEKAIYPVGFYHTKARTVHNISSDLLKRFSGKVPDDLETLLTLKGVGRKTANLVLTQGFNKLGICVDTHVHRISNRLGIVKTKDPEQTEFALRKILPKRYWIEYNDLLVAWGQNICKPVSPLCSKCVISTYCPKLGVYKSR